MNFCFSIILILHLHEIAPCLLVVSWVLQQRSIVVRRSSLNANQIFSCAIASTQTIYWQRYSREIVTVSASSWAIGIASEVFNSMGVQSSLEFRSWVLCELLESGDGWFQASFSEVYNNFLTCIINVLSSRFPWLDGSPDLSLVLGGNGESTSASAHASRVHVEEVIWAWVEAVDGAGLIAVIIHVEVAQQFRLSFVNWHHSVGVVQNDLTDGLIVGWREFV